MIIIVMFVLDYVCVIFSLYYIECNLGIDKLFIYSNNLN